MNELDTSDIVLATYLSWLGFDTKRMDIDGAGDCLWVYEDTEPLRQHLVEYTVGTASIPPKEYSREFARVRQGMYNFIKTVR